MTTADRLVGYQQVVAQTRWHVASVVRTGPSVYVVRAICGGLDSWVVPYAKGEVKDAADLPALETEHLYGRTVCPRCLARIPRAKVAS